MFQLEDIPLFSELDGELLSRLKQDVHIKQFSKESIVFYEGERSDYLYIHLDGYVRLYKTTPKGTQIEIHRFAPPGLIAEFAFFEKAPFPATCEFITDGMIGMLHFDRLYGYLKNEKFSLELIKSLTKKISTLSSYVHREAVFSSEAKVADFILKNHGLFSKLKNSEIATILNLTPETFSRVLSRFRKNGFISIDAHDFDILQRDALHQIVESRL